MRPFRFGLVWDGESSPVEAARRAEQAGYSTLLFPDHTGMMAPLPAMAAAAAVTRDLRIGTQVINVAMRPLGVLAQELAAIDLISDGRLEVGIGAGAAEPEVRSLGLPFPPARERVADVIRTVHRLRQLFAGESVTEEPGAGRLDEYELSPVPPQGARVPVMIGGNGAGILRAAAEQADIVQFTGFTAAPAVDFRYFSRPGLADRVRRVREAAGERFEGLELSLLAQRAGTVGDPEASVGALRSVATGVITAKEALDGPFVLLGAPDEIVEKLLRLREELGISYVAIFDATTEHFDPVVSRLAGR
jgi:probable F420-dependent oxidoreductase